MIQKSLLGGVVAAFAAMAFALVLVSGAGTASAAIDGLSASTTTVNAATIGAVVLTIDADEGSGDVRLLATGGDFTACTDAPADAVAGTPDACAFDLGSAIAAFTNPGSDIDFTVDDGAAAAAGGNVDTLLVTWSSPTTGPASVVLTAIQGTSAKSVTVTVRGTASTVELSALIAAPAAGTTCPGTVANVINSTTATTAGGLTTAFLCTLVKDSNGTRLPSQAVIYSTTDGTVAPLVDTTTATGSSAVASTLTAGTTGANGDKGTVTASSAGKSATVDVLFGGNPATCVVTTNPGTVQTGGSAVVDVELKDSASGPIPDGVAVAVVQTNPGAGANAAILNPAPTTLNGKASTTLIAAIPGAIALGASAGPAGGVISCTGSVIATGTVAPPSGGTSGTGGFTGTAPAAGSIGLLVTSEASDAAGLIAALGTAGCTVESLAVLEAGTWKVYINGAPAVVNAAFPASRAATTPFFTRCA